MPKPSLVLVSAALIAVLSALSVHSADKASQPKPDLSLRKFKIDPKNPKRGDWVTMSAQVFNKGSAPSAPCQAAIRINDESDPPMYALPKLDPEEAFTITREQKLNELGRYKVTFIADYYKTVDERKETNNAQYVRFMVKEKQ